jgi:hypothetical protein
MYLHRPEETVISRLCGSARTLVAIVVTAVLASALTVYWSDASATGSLSVTPGINAAVTAVPVAVEGTVVGASDGLLAVVEHGAQSPVAFPVGQDAQLARQGQPVPLDALRPGDMVSMTIDGTSGSVLRLQAQPVASGPLQVSGTVALMAAFGLIGGAAALTIRNIERLPRLSSRPAATRLLPAAMIR